MFIPSRFSRAFFLIVIALFLLGSIALLHAPSRAYIDPWTGDFFGEGGVEKDLHLNDNIAQRIGQGSNSGNHRLPPLPAGKAKEEDANAHGGVIMSKLGNATAKAELGRATWKLLHTMTLRYPEKPTEDERDALSNYFHLFSRLYPCGECAQEFQQLLKKFPPQTSSRRTAATWLCFVHNQVNARLHKPEFDCADLDATYDCGCGDEPVGSASSSAATSSSSAPSLWTGNGVVHDPMDLEFDPSKDLETGVGMIKGGK